MNAPFRSWFLATLAAAILLTLGSASVGWAREPARPNNQEPRQPAINEDQDEVNDPRTNGGRPYDWRQEVRVDQAPFSNRQIAYEIRYLEMSANPWRDRLKDDFRPAAIEDKPNETAWLLDEKQLHALMNLLDVAFPSGLVQAPRRTAFERSRVTVDQTYLQDYVSDVELVRQPGPPALKPKVQTLTLGTTIEFSGTIHDGATRLALEFHDQELEAFHDLSRTAESPEGLITAPYQIPSTKDRYYRLSCSIPEGSTLMLSLGIQERPWRPLSGLTKVVAELLEANASPPLEVKVHGEPVERFILITPRQIIQDAPNAQAAR